MLQAATALVYNRADIIRRSICNSHNFGLHHIKFIDTKEIRIHAYVALENHEIHLFHNSPKLSDNSEELFTYHSHDSDIVIAPISGTIYNRRALLSEDKNSVTCNKFTYKKIAPFIEQSNTQEFLLQQDQFHELSYGDYDRMTFDEMHCV